MRLDEEQRRLRKDYMKELVALIFSISVISACGAAKSSLESVHSGGTAQMDAAAADSGTLRVSTMNPRYFTDSSGKPIYLTGSHTWTGLIDRGAGDPPARFRL